MNKILNLTDAQFPRALCQADNSFRFAADSLLLAKFVAQNISHKAKFLELGTGCGVVSLALLLELQSKNKKLEDFAGLGLDFYPEHLDCAKQNAQNLGLDKYFNAKFADFRNPMDFMSVAKPNSFDLVFANPPWRERTKGRVSKHAIRADALFAYEDTFLDFCKVAAYFLRENGILKLICVPEQEKNILSALKKYNFHLESLDFAQLAESKKAQRLLICANKYNNLFTN